MQGGVETHAQGICPQLVKLGCDVHVISRSTHQKMEYVDQWCGIQFHNLWTVRSKGFEALLHTFVGVLYAGLLNRPDILRIHAIGPSIMVPLARLLGLRVVVTHHGPDYDRQKWGWGAKKILEMGERFGMRWSNSRIVISEVIRRSVKKKFHKDCRLIPNGVSMPNPAESLNTLVEYGLVKDRYILLVSRFVPEKRHLDLIAAFKLSELEGWKLVLVGSSDHPDEYSKAVLDLANKTKDCVCTGFQTGANLNELYTFAGLFVLPSSHEGLPIAILEALSYGLLVVASDIPANLEMGLSKEQYFSLGDISDLASKLKIFCAASVADTEKQMRKDWVEKFYNWEDIAAKTLAVYKETMQG